MPGFSIDKADGLNNRAEVRRKHRWSFVTLGTQSMTAEGLLWLRKAQRPEVEVAPIEMHYDQERVWHTGRHFWSDIKLIWYDSEQPDISSGIYDWLNEIVNVENATASTSAEAKRDSILQMTLVDQVSEQWFLKNSWPTKVNWGELDYASSDFAEVEVTLKFDRASRIDKFSNFKALEIPFRKRQAIQEAVAAALAAFVSPF